MQTIYQENSNTGGRRSGSERRMFADPDYAGLEKRVSADRRKRARERQNKRFQAKEGTYAAIKSDYTLIGLIKDISKGGLSFRYIVNGKRIRGSMTIDIFSKGKGFYLKKVPFKITSDFHVDSKVQFSTIELRQCGGRFSVLTDNQISQLDRFIQNYTSRSGGG